MKTFAALIFLIIIPFVFGSCDENRDATQDEKRVSTEQSSDLKVGGLYLFQNEDKTYYITKILVIDNFAVHVRTYSDNFKTKPNDINFENLKILIGHAPIDKNGFLIDKPELLKVEKVKESELEGYKMYLEEISK